MTLHIHFEKLFKLILGNADHIAAELTFKRTSSLEDVLLTSFTLEPKTYL